MCVCVLDISPAVQGIDHRQVQKELGDVIVTMHSPIVLSSTSVRVTWAVSSRLAFLQFFKTKNSIILKKSDLGCYVDHYFYKNVMVTMGTEM